MNSLSHHLRYSNSLGVTTILVLVGVVVISILAMAVLSAQKNLFQVVQKVENQTVQLDVANLCLNTAINNLIDNSSKGTLSVSTVNYIDVAIQANKGIVDYANQISGSVSNKNPGAITVKNQYAGTVLSQCRYIYLFERPVTNGILGGEIVLARSYGRNIALESIYKVEAVTCASNSSPCDSIRTESVYYVGIQ